MTSPTPDALLFGLLGSLVAGQAYPDQAPEGAGLPRIVYQQVGGVAVDHAEGKPADLENARMQIHCWAATRDEATTLARQVEDVLLADPSLQANRLGARTSLVDEATGLRGARQDYSLWLPR